MSRHRFNYRIYAWLETGGISPLRVTTENPKFNHWVHAKVLASSLAQLARRLGHHTNARIKEL